MRSQIAILLLIGGVAAAETPIKGLSLQSDANAGGHLITNLGAGFAAAAGLASSGSVAAASALASSSLARWTATNVAIGFGAVAEGKAPVVFAYSSAIDPASASGYYYEAGQFEGVDCYTNSTGWALWDSWGGSFLSPGTGDISRGWYNYDYTFPHGNYEQIDSSTTGTVMLVPAGTMPIVQIGSGTNTTAGTMGWMGHPLARWDGSVWIGTQWVERVYPPLFHDPGRMIDVTNAPVLNGIVVYGGANRASWQIPTGIVAIATNVVFSEVSGQPKDNPALAVVLTTLSNLAASAISAASRAGAPNWRDPYWFKVSFSEHPTNAPDTTVTQTNLDRIIFRDSWGAIRRDRIIQLSGMRGFYPVDYMATPTNVAVVSSNGYVQHLADGVATVTVSTHFRSSTNLLYFLTQPGSSVERNSDGATGTVRRSAIDGINAGVTGGQMTVFSSLDHATAVYVRNTNLFLRPAPACLAVWSSASSFSAEQWNRGVLLTPRHAVLASHVNDLGVGVTCRWVRADNVVTDAVVTASVDLGSDVSLIRLDRAITGISPAKLIAPELAIESLPTGLEYLPMALAEAHGEPRMQCVVGASSDLGRSDIFAVNASAPVDPTWRTLFYHSPIIGDSSSPIFCVIGGDLVLVTELYASIAGPSMSYWSPAIQAQIAAWGDTNMLEFINHNAFRRF